MVSAPDVLDEVMHAVAVPVASVVGETDEAGVVPEAGGQEPAVKVTSPSVLNVTASPDTTAPAESFTVAVACDVDVPSAAIEVGFSASVTVLAFVSTRVAVPVFDTPLAVAVAVIV